MRAEKVPLSLDKGFFDYWFLNFSQLSTDAGIELEGLACLGPSARGVQAYGGKVMGRPGKFGLILFNCIFKQQFFRDACGLPWDRPPPPCPSMYRPIAIIFWVGRTRGGVKFSLCYMLLTPLGGFRAEAKIFCCLFFVIFSPTFLLHFYRIFSQFQPSDIWITACMFGTIIIYSHRRCAKFLCL